MNKDEVILATNLFSTSMKLIVNSELKFSIYGEKKKISFYELLRH